MFAVRAPGLFALAFVLGTGAASAQQSPTERPAAPVLRGEADTLFDKGAQAYAAGRLDLAEWAFQAAWAKKRTHDTAANLGLVELKLGKHRAAADHLAWALEHSPPTDPTDTRRRVLERLDDAKAHVVTYRVQADVDGAEIVVAGAPAAAATKKGAPVPVFADPGPVHIVVRRASYEPFAASLEGAAGDSRDVPAHLAPVSVPPSPAPGETSSRPAGRSHLPELLLGAGGVAATATAVGFLVAAGNSTEEADGLLLALRAKEGKQAVCPSSRYAAACSEIESRRQDHDTFRNVGVTALVVGGAALATAIGWFVFAPDQPAKTGSQAIAPRASLTPWGGPAAGGASVVGRF